MSKHTPKAGTMPNASIDFNKVHENARAGRDDIFKGAVHAPAKAAAPEKAAAEAQAKAE